MASTSRARATFQSELIERSTDDDLPNNVKGAAVYKTILGNKIVKNLKIFVEVDYLRSRGVLCQP